MNVPPTEFIRVPAEALRSLSAALFAAAGLPRPDAELISGLLVETDLRGVLSHGTRTINGYVRAFLEGRLNPVPRVRAVREDAVTAIVDGDGGLGHLAAARAAELAISRARSTGLGATVSRNHGHFGSAGKYTRMAMRHNCVGFCVSGHTMAGIPADPPQWNPLGCPPMSFAFPSGAEAPVILDMGTSFFGPDEYADLFERMPAPFFKSLGLVAVANLLSGVLGGMMAPQFRPANRRWQAAFYGAFILAVDIGRFAPVEEFKAEMDRTLQEIHTLPPLKGCARYELPGGLEWERERAWAIEGIPLGDEHRRSLEEIAGQLGVAVPWG